MSISASLLPNGKQQFLDAGGNPLAGGSVQFYIPGTTTPKTTWIDPQRVTPNSNPVILDSGGFAVIYGTGQYRQIVKDSLGNLIWDQLTCDLLGLIEGNLILWGGTSGGSANAQTITTNIGLTGYSVPLIIAFIAGFTNTAATTINIDGLGVKNIYKESGSGPVALAGGEIIAGNIYQLFYDGTEFQITSALANSFPGSEVTIASATTTSLSVNGTNALAISGTNTITSFGPSGSLNSAFYFVRFTGALTIDYNSSSLITPSQNNILVQDGDTCVVQDLGGSNWKIVEYTKNSGQPLSAFGPEVTLASAGTTDLGSQTSNSIFITGTTTITSFGNAATLGNQLFLLRFEGILQVTYNATSMQTPGAVNLITQAGAQALVQYLGSGNWKFVFYQSSSSSTAGGIIDVQVFTTSGTFTWDKPTGTNKIEVTVVGGGGGVATGGAPGAPSAALAYGFFTSSIPSSATVIVGAGGDNITGAAGDSTFGSLIGAQAAGGNPTGTYLYGISGEIPTGEGSQGGFVPGYGTGGHFNSDGIGFGSGGGGSTGASGGNGAGGILIIKSYS